MQAQAGQKHKKRWPIYTGTGILILGVAMSPLKETILKTIGLSQQTVKKDQFEYNSDYLLFVANRDPSLSLLLKNGWLPALISKKLSGMQHADRPNGNFNSITIDTPSETELKQLHEVQLIKIYYLLQALGNEKFRQRIGRELLDSSKEAGDERGGILRLTSDGTVKTTFIRNTRPHSGQYVPQWQLYEWDMLVPFHSHSFYENKPFAVAGLSPDDFCNLENQPLCTANAMVLFSLINIQKRAFNVDIGLMVKTTGNKATGWNLDLGVYSY